MSSTGFLHSKGGGLPAEKGSEKLLSVAYFLARYGAFSLGLIYVMIGVTALLSLLQLKDGGADEDSILEYLLNFQLGKLLIWVIIGGMLAYIIWKIVESVTDFYEYGSGTTGIIKRLGVAFSGIAYVIIGLSGIQALAGTHISGKGEEEQQEMVARVFEWTGGEWLIGAIGLITLITAIMELKYVISEDHEERLTIENLAPVAQKIIHVLAWVGHIARAIILLILSYFLIRSAVESDPKEVGDTDTAFNFIGEVIFGKTIGHPLFVLVAVGTIFYGLFMFVFGILIRFRRERG